MFYWKHFRDKMFLSKEMLFLHSKSILDLLKVKFNSSSFPGEEKWCQATPMRARCGNSLSGLLSSLGESRWRGGTDTYSRTGLWMGLWPNLAQFLNWEKALTKAECWLQANLLWTCRPLPGKLSTLSPRHLPSQGQEMPGQEAAPFPPFLTGWCQLLYSSHDQGRGRRWKEKMGKWGERR